MTWLAAALGLLLVSAKHRSVDHPTPPELQLDPERSFVVIDTPLIEGITFARVLDAITKGSNVTSEQLFRQWWSTQTEPQCRALLNGYARKCPTSEGRLATAPYTPDDFRPIGVINRFDQADDTQCGQYRLIFTSRDTMEIENFHLIFEAELPNPHPELGIAGCRPVAQFWADLSEIDSAEERRARMERFFFDGIDGFEPAVHPDHYRGHQAGIRTLQFTMPDNVPHFFQFRVVREDGALVVTPDVLEASPAAALIDADTADGQRFREALLQNVKNLAVDDENLFHIELGEEFLLPDSQPLSSMTMRFETSRRTEAGRAYEEQLAAELHRIGSALTPTQVVLRAETQSCMGCHFGGIGIGDGLTFPLALVGAQHVSEDAAAGGRPQKYAISPAMRDVFIPHRMEILRDFLRFGKAPVHAN